MTYAAIVSLISGAACWYVLNRWQALDGEAMGNIAQAYASVAVTMLGFMLAMLAILVSVADKRLIRNLGRIGLYDKMLQRHFLAAIWYGMTMAASLACLFLGDPAQRIAISAATGLMAGATFCLILSSTDLWTVMKHIVPKDNSPIE